MVIDFKCQKCYKILHSRDLLRKHEAQCYTSENEEIQVESPLDKTSKVGKFRHDLFRFQVVPPQFLL